MRHNARVFALSATLGMGCSTEEAVQGRGDLEGQERWGRVPSTAILLGELVNPADGSVIEDAVVVIQGDRFTYVGDDEDEIPCGATIIDWSDYTGLPGLVDSHTHLFYQTDDAPGFTPWQRSSFLGVNDLPAVTTLARAAAVKTLQTGVTTIVDKGAGSRKAPLALQLRDEFATGVSPGPRLFNAGAGIAVSSTSTLETVVAAVQLQVATGIDLVKIWADSCSANNLICNPNGTLELLTAAVDEAHALGVPIAIHAYHRDTAALAIAAGTDFLEHTEGLTEDDFAAMVANDITYVPTIDHNRYYMDNLAYFSYAPEVGAELEAFIQLNLQTVSFAHAAGVTIAMGSDAVFTGFGQNTRELEWLVDAGMSELDALRSATSIPAAAIGAEDDIGQVAEGFYADIIAIDGDPLCNISDVIDEVAGVVKGGVLVVP